MLTQEPDKVYSPDDIIYTNDIEARIVYLQYIPTPEEDEDELTRLRDFRDQAVDTWGAEAWEHGFSLVAESYWDKYAAERSSDIYGEATKTGYWDDERWASDLQRGYEAVSYDGDAYLSDGNG